MSYAIIRNTNYKMGQLGYVYRHNERKNTNYSNKYIENTFQVIKYLFDFPINKLKILVDNFIKNKEK